MENKTTYLIPGAIVLAGLIVAGAVFYSSGQKPVAKVSDTNENDSSATQNIRQVSEDDHILGDPSAQIVIVEFSDLECPFCKSFHETMKQVIEKYGESRQVAWVYRHLPLDSIHPKAKTEAHGAECAGDLGGKVKFWEYVNAIFAITPSNNRLDLTLLPDIAEELGIDRGQFDQCMQSNRHAERVARDAKDALASGARGTPYSVMIVKDKGLFPVSGALPFEQMDSLIQEALQ